jgi:hypothetical protein
MSCAPAEIVSRALAWVGKGTYLLGSGGYDPTKPSPFRPGKRNDGTPVTYGCDCSGFVCHCIREKRTQHGFNVGPWANVSHCLNTDSIHDDALNKQELFEYIDEPEEGCVIVYPGVWLMVDGKLERVEIGHIGINTSKRPATWDRRKPRYELLQVAHCSPSKKARGWLTGVKLTNGAIWNGQENRRGGNPMWRTILARVKQR